MDNPSFEFGMIGLGVMGRNLLLNMADHGFATIGFDKDAAKCTLLESSASPNTKVKGAATLKEMVQQLKKPRKLMMLVPAGPIVDSVINDLLPLLETGDMVATLFIKTHFAELLFCKKKNYILLEWE